MKLRYLCPNHRNWILSNDHKADQYWLSWIETANIFHQTGKTPEAIPYIGCSFEVSEHLLSLNSPDHKTSVKRFTYSSQLLAEAYYATGDNERCNYILEQASLRLAKELKKPDLAHYVTTCMHSLQLTQPLHYQSLKSIHCRPTEH